MQIVITLNSYEELIATARQICEQDDARKKVEADTWVPIEEPKKTPAKKAAPVKAEPEETEAKTEEPAEASESDVKVMLAGKIKAGKKAEVRALFEEYGVTKLSELTAKYPEKLAEFAEKAEAL